VDAVLAALENAAKSSVPTTQEWSQASLEKLSGHIVATHHAYVKSELPRLAVLAEKVVRRHGDTQPELPLIQIKLAQLDEELSQHLLKEEAVLFPYVVKLESALKTGSAMSHGCFGTVANLIAMMTAEHDAAQALIPEIHQLSNHYVTPVGACPTYHAFYDGLKEFEQDLHQHIHLGNDILFPRAIQLEIWATRTNT
jgi:regulator of cell morphogenesis and NO signaling